MRGATSQTKNLRSCQTISIHAPHAGRDVVAKEFPKSTITISIHAPHAGRDIPVIKQYFGANAFQSTRPMRGATVEGDTDEDALIHFNPRAPCGARRVVSPKATVDITFQSTRPMRGATNEWDYADGWVLFQSTRPMRGATRYADGHYAINQISIHAPHAGRDFRRPE